MSHQARLQTNLLQPSERMTCMQAKHDGITAALLALLAAMLDVCAAASFPEAMQTAAQQLASSIVARRMKVADRSP